ncbi:hypothetical protein [Candidatus Midichloria mitochondrii]|uniref:Uncharacterized protein n=1 Tax=Midichloria mitochondrii (strain IricVA) TaxID=696127 RepID=F7XX29_MIDMI|nr:hypothetical protein [Candidatus Midichloria mitochondrii]AEI89228.1 hypothetical protein midi_00947 [Candidatus Midichloria mitochondrii IricVA]MDJ1288120.1 hypothetical protein [Candidatus Midichloria mitochondrii]MDJ1298986.1 hypothetical protein [Candidatus Midichloria mitochondrii]
MPPRIFELDDDFGYEGSNLHDDNQTDIIEQDTFFYPRITENITIYE